MFNSFRIEIFDNKRTFSKQRVFILKNVKITTLTKIRWRRWWIKARRCSRSRECSGTPSYRLLVWWRYIRQRIPLFDCACSRGLRVSAVGVHQSHPMGRTRLVTKKVLSTVSIENKNQINSNNKKIMKAK